ncbi:MAG TPA: DNA translocase FtsK [Firmicutes bacterium]|nr:DNA translocase FtsK [Bacillota bacterium]
MPTAIHGHLVGLGRMKTATNTGKGPRPTRWPWIAVGILGVLLVTSLGISTSKPTGHGWALTFTLWVARNIASIAGNLAMYLCFLLVLTSLVKITRPHHPLPKPVWGLWTLLFFGTALWHNIKIPWENTFTMAKMGAGGGLLGASLNWFLRVALGRIGTLLVTGLGLWVGLSLLLNKSAYAPFTFLWMLCVTAGQKIRGFLRDFFRAQGPREEDIEYEVLDASTPGAFTERFQEIPQKPETQICRQSDEDLEKGSPFSTAVSEIREKLSKVSKKLPQTDEVVAGPGKGADSEEFAPVQMEQPLLTEDMFYELPPLNILVKSDPQKRTRSFQRIDERAKIIEKTLLSFGVAGKVVNVSQGPTVTRFELQPGPGVKVASIVSLSQDLALALAAQDVRMEAPIPGKSAVGIEVPNRDVSMVHLRDVLESREFKNSPSTLTVALGTDISGRSVVTSLDKCVHLLIAGATGAGKSVCINSIIASILFKARPDQVKLLLVDPKRVELSAWSRVPHLIAPVVTDPKKASSALRWAIKEMESRYEKFTKVGTRDIERYNEIATPPGSIKPALPYIVIIIDELSDLMMVAPAEVEDAIFRLAQMARASGIYLVVATQRPSVDVITGTIKANIPSRIAFAVSSQIDSRTILDMGGAEKLLGRGDMLFFPVGAAKPLRAQGAYLSEREIDEIVSFTSNQAKPQFAPGVLSVPESTIQEVEIQEDPLFPQAVRIVVEAKQASVSLLQRRLPIGYSRAARLIDAMELKGYIGPYEGSKPREVKLSLSDYMGLFEGQIQGGNPDSEPVPGQSQEGDSPHKETHEKGARSHSPNRR